MVDETAAAAYQAMLDADEIFRQALITAYGQLRAGDARYQRAHPAHPEVEAAARAFVEASERWRALLPKGRFSSVRHDRTDQEGS